MTRSVRSGLEVLLADGSTLLAGKRIGLVTNPTGVDGRLRSAVDLLRSNGRMQLVALFAPEHGIRGEAQAGAPIADTVDQRSGLPVHSLYGATRKPTPAALAELDAIVFDIQDVGARFATYISTLALVLEAAADVGTLAVVLDRPNPLNGVDVEGGSLAEGFASFVGMYAAPIRHGLTMGELARLFAVERGLPRPTIVAMEGWKRELWFDETGLPWVQPSPNLPTLDAVTLYPGTCLVEGTSVSEGRGTTRPFELVGAPWIDPFALAEDLGARRIPGVRFRPVYFTPTFSKHAGVSCGGVQVHVVDRLALRPVALGLHLLVALRSQDPRSFSWRQNSDGRYVIDLLYGTDRLRRSMEEGLSASDLAAASAADVADFERRRADVLLYR
ncbi:MAG: DUF1343 domain-containing protein [Chloroflexi bacterium]|nr:MAG: DUF1343 domain-containing protein [Chloroflexota bacterium]